jgi:hypothetical protein
MIVIGVDVHKHSVTAVAADEMGRTIDERTVACGSDELVAGLPASVRCGCGLSRTANA